MTNPLLNPIFLSASIPDREPYVHHSDPVLIREAILALVSVTVCDRELVFGGHPAISPLVDYASRSLGAEDNVFIYQSRWFEDVIPDVAKEFGNLIWTERGPDRQTSLYIMRREMICSKPFAAAVFIGGMEGVEEECDLFKENYGNSKPIFPIASTLGAAWNLFNRGEGPPDDNLREALKSSKRYSALFRSLLSEF